MIIKKTLLCLSIVALMSGCNNSSDDTKSSDTKVKNVILMINDGASYGTWDMASYWSEGKLANDSSVYSDMKVRLGVSTYPLNTSNDPTYSDESLVM